MKKTNKDKTTQELLKHAATLVGAGGVLVITHLKTVVKLRLRRIENKLLKKNIKKYLDQV